MNKRILLLNGTMLFCIANFFTTTLHELAHFVMAHVLHAGSILLYHNAVQYDSSVIPISSHIMIAAAGPVFSLLLGMLFHFICKKYNVRNFFFFFSVLMSALCYINFFGYLCLAPLFPDGDTGFVMRQLHVPMAITISLAFGGGIPGYILIKNSVRPYLLEMASSDILQDDKLRKDFIDYSLGYPILIGVVITTLLTFPVQVFLSILYPLCSPFALYWGYNKFLQAPSTIRKTNSNFDQLSKLSSILLIIFIITIVCNRLLVLGLSF